MDELRELERRTTERIHALQGELEENRDMAILANTLLAPHQYHGTGHESPKRFIAQFQKVATAQGWNDEKMLRTMPLYLAGSADRWYTTLEKKPQTFDDFITQINRQFNNPALRLIGKQQFHLMSQGENESIDAYVARITDVADKYDIQPDETRDQFLSGLTTKIKKQVYTLQPETFQEAVHTALLAEIAMTPKLPDENRAAEPKQQIMALKQAIAKQQNQNQIDALKDEILLQSRADNPDEYRTRELHDQLAEIISNDEQAGSSPDAPDETLTQDNRIAELKQKVQRLCDAVAAATDRREKTLTARTPTNHKREPTHHQTVGLIPTQALSHLIMTFSVIFVSHQATF